MRTSLIVSLVVAAPPLVAQANPASRSASPAPTHVAVKAAHLIDPRGQGRRIDDAVVLIDGDTIVQVGTKLTVPNGYTTVDLGSATVLPGLIDVHTHLTSQQTDYYEGLFRRSAIDVAITAPTNAKRTLDAGFTSVRYVPLPAEPTARGPLLFAATLSVAAGWGWCGGRPVAGVLRFEP